MEQHLGSGPVLGVEVSIVIRKTNFGNILHWRG